MTRIFFLSVMITCWLINGYSQSKSVVNLTEKQIPMPTHVIAPVDKNPIFFRNEAYQGASHHYYPLKLGDQYTNERITQEWKTLVLENEYIEPGVTPDIGGKLYYATDKTNDYHFIYKNEVVRPGNIGMVHFGDHNITKGAKLWEWGSGPSGQITEGYLAELQTQLINIETGEALIEYQYVERAPVANEDLLKVWEGYPDTTKIETIEEMYLTGKRVEQFYAPRHSAMDWYKAVLEKDPGDIRTNIAVGNINLINGNYISARKYFATAIKRATNDYTIPASHEALYLQGLTLRNLDLIDEAEDTLYRATWDYAFHSAAYFQLAELSCAKYERNNTPVETRIKLFEGGGETVKNRDDAFMWFLETLILANQADKAVDYLDKAIFAYREGSSRSRNVKINANLVLGKQYFEKKEYQKALDCFLKAQITREEAGNDRMARIYTMRGLGYKGLGENQKAKEDQDKAVELSQSNLWAIIESIK